MYIPTLILQTLHEDRIREARQYARRRSIIGQPSASLFSRINALFHLRAQQESREARHAHAVVQAH